MGRKGKLQNNKLVPTNCKDWDVFFKAVRGRIEWVMKPGRNPQRGVSDLVIKRFRGCISALSLFQYNEPFLWQKSKDLLALIVDLCIYARSITGTPPPSLIVLLEVFIREALAHPTLRRLLGPSGLQIVGVSGSFLIRELVLAHLRLSFPKHICVNFTDSFCRSLSLSTASNDKVGLELGLDSTLALLSTGSSSSMPYLLQAHVAMLASKCIETQIQQQVSGSGFDRAISAFELSGKLYWRCLHDVDLGQRARPYLSRGAKNPCLNQASHSHMDELMLLFQHTSPDIVAQKDLFLWISSYIDEIQETVHESSSRLQTGNTLKVIVSMLLADKELGGKRAAGCKISEELVSVAALARLMATSLFQVVAEARAIVGHAQRPNRREKHLELEGQLMSSLNSESDAECHLVGSKADQIVRKILLSEISVGSSSRKKSVLMLQHFVKLMLFGLRARVDFLWKACILVLSAIMNLMAFEGEFDALKMLSGDTHDPVEVTKDSTRKRKSNKKQLDSSVFPSRKRVHLADKDPVNFEGSCKSKESMRDSQEERIPEVHAFFSENGELVEFFEHPPADLVDFLDCSSDNDDLEWYLRKRSSLSKERQAAQKKKRKMLSKLLGMNI
ncbi:hypothetical protein LUZ61_004735 [Rhynchospora tenuis]|uniref:DUF7812 domain-containing protein n=1 Tax=Rhynchospora tenuis TaxID=198213 RepID=A0AAD5ZN89_9POAL|nr:hypothetical protein LUZ61_004735 [Rhynchospora tenuis]